MKLSKLSAIASGTFLLPFLAMAQLNNSTPIGSLLLWVKSVINFLIPLAIAVAVLVFFYFIIMYIVKGSQDPEMKAKSMHGIWMSLLAIGIMLTFFGIIKIVAGTLGLQPGEDVYDTPGVNF